MSPTLIASIQVGGDAAVLERVRPYLATMGPNGVTHVGPLGIAKAMKVATNLGVAVQILAFCEAVALAETRAVRRRKDGRARRLSGADDPEGSPARARPGARARGSAAPDRAHTGVDDEARAMGLGDQDFAVVFHLLASLSGRPPAIKASGA
jgi:hypothetical protein